MTTEPTQPPVAPDDQSLYFADLDPETRTKIDAMNREMMEEELRKEDPTSELRQGLAGEYFDLRFTQATGGMTSDDFNKQLSMEREQEQDGPDEEMVEVLDDEEEGEGEAVETEAEPPVEEEKKPKRRR